MNRTRFVVTPKPSVRPILSAALVVLCTTVLCLADNLEVSPVISDGMVLQRGVAVPIWGTADPDAVVNVAFAGQTHEAKADEHGRWRIELDPMPADATGRDMTISSGDQAITLTDVLVGEVWVCAGQSNMAWPLEKTPDGEEQAASSVSLTTLRLFDPQQVVDGGPKDWPMETVRSFSPDTFYQQDGWEHCGEVSSRRFSAIGFYFGKMLNEKLGVPIGLIDVAVGGTPVQAWVPRQQILDDPDLRELDEAFTNSDLADSFINQRPGEQWKLWIDVGRPEPMPEHYYRCGFMYSTGIEPYAGLPIAGIIWYQGESNVENIELHDRLFPMAVAAWRDSFGRGDLPVFWAQLPGFSRYAWPEFREDQARLTRIDHTGMAVTIDLGDPANIHPRVKQPVGERFARLALNRVYGQPVADSGPTPSAVTRDGGAMRISFDHAAEGLELRDSTDGQSGFWVAGDDRRFTRASARVVDGEVIVASDLVPEPVAVRYAWEPFPPVTLFNSEGLPAAPFRSDDWPDIRVACVGDSITFGMGTSNANLYSYPAQLEQRIGPLFDVRNYGVSGSTVVNGFVLKGWDRGYARQLPYRQSLVHNPDVVVINLGINDVNEDPFDADQFVRDYVALIGSYRSLPSQPRVLIWGRLAPIFEGHRFHGHPRLEMIRDAIDRVVAETGVTTIDMASPLADQGQHFDDQIHPDDEAAGIIAQAVLQALSDAGLPTALTE
jgi:sialate O-acetylesterase